MESSQKTGFLEQNKFCLTIPFSWFGLWRYGQFQLSELGVGPWIFNQSAMAPNDWPSEFRWLECYEKHTPNHKKHIPKLVVSFSTQITWSHSLGKKSSTQKITESNRNWAAQVCQGTGWLKRANVKCKVWPSLLVVQSLGCQGRRYSRPSVHTQSTIGVNLDILFLCSTECELRTENGGIECNYWDQLVWYVLTSRRLSFFGFSIVLYICRSIGMATSKGL